MTTSLLSSCNDDDKGGGQPVIEGVRVTDPALADSLFEQAYPGKMIAIIGRNLGNCQRLYINDQKVSFNPNLNTDHSIIVTIPTEEDNDFKLTAFNPNLKSEIRLETLGGVATYSFKVLAPTPHMERIAGKYPRRAGDVITVYGQNFLDLERVYFTDVNPRGDQDDDDADGAIIATPVIGNEIEVTDFTLDQERYIDPKTKKYVTDSKMSAVLPSIPYDNGYLVMVTPQGTSVIDYAAIPPMPIVKNMSSDMPIPGTKVTLYGSYFVEVQSIKIGDDIVVPGSDVTVEENESELSFILPAKPQSTTTIQVVTPGGTSPAMAFYPYETLLLDFDDTTYAKDNNWSPNAQYLVATPDAAPYVSDGKFALFSGKNTASNWWGTMVFWDTKVGNSLKFPDFSVIAEDTPLDDVYLKFEVYNEYVFTKSIEFKFVSKDGSEHKYENWDSSNGVQFKPEFQDQFGDPHYGEWYMSLIPLSRFAGFEGKTYKDFVNSDLYRIRIMLFNKTGQAEDVFFGFDNLRISTLEKGGAEDSDL